MSYVAKHLLWLQEASTELQHTTTTTPTLYGDNQGTLSMIRNHKVNDLTKHVILQYHYMCNLVFERGCFDVEFVHSSDNLADACTKSLARLQFMILREAIMNSSNNGSNTLSYLITSDIVKSGGKASVNAAIGRSPDISPIGQLVVF